MTSKWLASRDHRKCIIVFCVSRSEFCSCCCFCFSSLFFPAFCSPPRVCECIACTGCLYFWKAIRLRGCFVNQVVLFLPLLFPSWRSEVHHDARSEFVVEKKNLKKDFYADSDTWKALHLLHLFLSSPSSGPKEMTRLLV